MYGINRIDINTIYSVNYHALIDTGVTCMKHLFYKFSPRAPLPFCKRHLSLMSALHNTQSTNVLTVVSFEDLPHWYSLAKIHAFGLEL